MATKRIVPAVGEESIGIYVFADGPRQIPEFERMYLDDALVRDITEKATGVAKSLKELTYPQWLEQIFSVMQVRNQFIGEVMRQRAVHFARNPFLGVRR